MNSGRDGPPAVRLPAGRSGAIDTSSRLHRRRAPLDLNQAVLSQERKTSLSRSGSALVSTRIVQLR